jgi:hypothetical protein
MIQNLTLGLVSALVSLTGPGLLAQSGAMPPPALIQVFQEEVKPGRGAAHAASEQAWAKLAARGKSTDYYLGMTSMTGPNEAWFLSGYASYAELEAKQKEMDRNPALKEDLDKAASADGELLNGTRSFIASLRKDLSYGPDVEIGKMRYFRVRTFRLKQGQNDVFEAGFKTALATYAKIKLAGSFACFTVTAGAPGPTYVLVRPMKSLAELDAFETSDKAFKEALGEEGAKAMTQRFGEAVQSVQNQLFAFSPKMSYPWPGAVASDPEYWTPKAKGKSE